MADNSEEERVRITFNTNAGDVSKQTNALGASIDGVTNATNENTEAVKKEDVAYKALKTQLREANAELQRSIQLYGETSAETVRAARSVAELRDQIEFARDISETFNPDQRFRALGAASQVAATGVQGVTAGLALFGDQSEDTEKALLKVQSAMAFSDAISNLSNLGDQWALLKASIMSSSIATAANTAATGAAAIVQKAFTGSVATTSSGFKLLKLAIAGTGIGLLVVGIAALITNFDKVKEVVLNLVPGLATVGEFIGDIVQSVTDFVGVTSEADRAMERIKQNADQSLALNKKFLEEHESQLDDFTKQKIAAKNKYLEAIKEDGADQEALGKELNRNLAKITQDREDELQKNREAAAEKEKAAAEKRRKEAEDADKKANEEQLKKKVDIKLTELETEQELNDLMADVNAQNLERQKNAEVENAKQTAEEVAEVKKIAADIEFEESQKRLDARLKAEEENKKALLSNGEQLIKNVAALAGKNKAIQKAAIIADGAVSLGKAVANTAEAVTKDLAKGAPFSAPLVALDIAVGATSAAAIIKNTNSALQAVGSGGGGLSASGGGVSAPSIPQSQPSVAFNNTAENQIGQSIAQTQANTPPLQVFVAESDITTAQTNVQTLVQRNTFP